MKKWKRIATMILGAALMVSNVVPTMAATNKYGEDKPLTSVKTEQLNVTANHRHTYIEASNKCRYQIYDSCMDGMAGRVPTNHLSTITIDGIRYTLRNYEDNNGNLKYASVIKRIGGTSGSGQITSGQNTVQKQVPLQKITLNKTACTLTVGNTSSLNVSYSPSNTTDSKVVTWTSSNSSVASVSGGTVTAKKAGTATITAKAGSKTAKCTVTVKAKTTVAKESYKNVSEAYTLLNNFRKNKSNQWYWNKNNKSKTKTPGLKSLKKDSALEKIAKTRAKEQWIQFYQNGKATHTRPNGKSWKTAYPSGMTTKAENLGWGQTTCKKMITDPYSGWAETYEKYSGQGHRRIMLSKSYTKVGIACYVKNGKTCWAMCLAK